MAETEVNGQHLTNGTDAGSVDNVDNADKDAQVADNVFPLTINLPHNPGKIQVMVSTQEQVQDVRQTVIETPNTFQYSCFHLEHEGRRVNDFTELSEIPGITPDTSLDLVEDPYTEKEARIHFVRIRELIGAAGDRVDTLHGILSGLSLHDSVVKATQPIAATNGKTPKELTPDRTHALTEYDIEAPGSIDALLPPKNEEPAPKTIKSISLSPWNPPPYHLRQRGHLLYLQVTTNEGEQHQITADVSGFYVNKSSNNKFDPFPRPAPKDFRAHSLLSLISQLSPSFETSFKKLQEYNNRKDHLATYQLANAIPSNPWVVPSTALSVVNHQPDITRTQETYLIAGAETTETLRDWNEEFQSTRELPRDTVQERVLRERLTSKLFADYNEAATKGAIMVARGEVPALNPMEARDAQIYVYNNVFFSFGADGVGTFASEGGDEAARVATGKDVMGVRTVNQFDIPGLFTPGTVVVDYLGKRIVGQSIVPGIFKQREPDEHQIDYGGVEGKDVIASSEAFVPVFEKLSQILKVKKHPVWDKDGKRHDLEGSVETKGLLGTDGRKYVLDLYRITPLDVSWLEKHWVELPPEGHPTDGLQGYPHRMAVLRPELINAYWRTKMRAYVNSELEKKKQLKEKSAAETPEKKDEEKEANGADQEEPEQDRIDISDFKLSFNPDVFSGQAPQTEEEKEQWAKDEEDVRAVCAYLHDTAIPELLQDLKKGDVGFPMDGQSLSRLLHKRGINIRYLGKIATLAADQGSRLAPLIQLVDQEMIARAFKHIVNKHLRYLPVPFSGACISHLLNCLLGIGLNEHPVAEIDDDLRKLYSDVSLTFEKVTPSSLRRDIEAQVLLRYRYTLNSTWDASLKHIQLLREVSLKLGLQLEAREFAFSSTTKHTSVDEAPQTNGTAQAPAVNGQATGAGKKKKKAGADQGRQSPTPSELKRANHTFCADDVMNVVPVVKEAAPRSVLAEEAFEAARISIAQNQKDFGQELLLESLSLHEQIYGILHAEVARFYYQVSMIYYQLEEKNVAVELARKAVIVAERTLGLDSAETILSYLNLGLFEHGTGNTSTALRYIRHALDLWKVVYGLRHPDSVTTMNNAAVMLQHLNLYHDSRLWFEAALEVSDEIFGKGSVNSATLLFQLAQALALDHDSKAAVNRMREAYNIFGTELGKEDRNTKEAESWLEQLTQNAVSIAKHAKDLQAKRLRRVNLTTRAPVSARPEPAASLPTADTTGRNVQGAAGNMGLDQRSIDELIKFIEGGGDTTKRPPTKKRAGRGGRNPQARASAAAR